MIPKGYKKQVKVIKQLKAHKGYYYKKWLTNYLKGIKRWQQEQLKNWQKRLKSAKK